MRFLGGQELIFRPQTDSRGRKVGARASKKPKKSFIKKISVNFCWKNSNGGIKVILSLFSIKKIIFSVKFWKKKLGWGHQREFYPHFWSKNRFFVRKFFIMSKNAFWNDFCANFSLRPTLKRSHIASKSKVQLKNPKKLSRSPFDNWGNKTIN